MINVKTIDGLDYLKHDDNGLTIGALARLADIVKSPVVKEEYKLLAERCTPWRLPISVTWPLLGATLPGRPVLVLPVPSPIRRTHRLFAQRRQVLQRPGRR